MNFLPGEERQWGAGGDIGCRRGAPVSGLTLLGLAAQQNCIPILILINDLLQHMLQKYAERVGGYIENLSLRLKIRNGLAETSVIGPIKSVGSQARPGPARPER